MMVKIRRSIRVGILAALSSGIAISFGAFGLVGTTAAQTPPQGMDLTTGMDYACEGTLGYLGCENLMHPHPGRPLPPPKPDVWGALAITSGLNWGNAWNFKTKSAAQDEALRRCRSYPDGTSCKIAVTVADVCVSLAVSTAERRYWIGGPTGAINFASDNAKLQCQRAGAKACSIATSFCADGVSHMLRGETVFSNGNPIFVPEGQANSAFGRRR